MMANFQIGASLPEDDEDDEVGTKERRQSLRKKRHYKKDSRFLLDLYTLTFDEDETVDEIATTCQVSEELTSFSTPSSPSPSRSSSVIRSMTSAPPPAASVQPLMSLNFSERPALLQRKSIPSLETNLHKILARKFMDSEDVSFKKAKLLTKAYYQLLRTTSGEDEDVCEIQRGGDTFQSLSVGNCSSSSGQKRLLLRSSSSKRMLFNNNNKGRPGPLRDDRLSWPALLRADNKELSRMVTGLNNTVKALNDYLMELLQERDVLHSQQDDMLEHISELTDNLL